jgi:hypothetical protein
MVDETKLVIERTEGKSAAKLFITRKNNGTNDPH